MQLHRCWYHAINDTDVLTGLVFTSDSANLLSAGRGTHGIQFWDVENGESRGELAGRHDQATALATCAHGGLLAIGYRDGAIYLYDNVTSTTRVMPNAHTSEVTTLAFSPNGQHLASGSLDKAVHCWNIPNVSVPQFSLSNYGGAGQNVVFSPDDRYIAVIDDDAVCLWEVATTQRVAVFHDSRVESCAAAFHPNGGYIAIAGAEQTLTFWYPQEDRAETLFTGYNNAPCSIAFNQTGDYLILGMFSDDYPLRVWNIQSRRQQLVVAGNSDEGCYIAMSPDGRHLACRATGNTASIEIWRLSAE